MTSPEHTQADTSATLLIGWYVLAESVLALMLFTTSPHSDIDAASSHTIIFTSLIRAGASDKLTLHQAIQS
jgi:hypothetical protein